MTHTFGYDLERGRTGEYAATRLFEYNGWKVENISTDPTFYHRGDLFIEKGDKNFFVEVKTDYRAVDTGNMVIELTTNKELKHEGWFKKSTADKLVVLLPQTNEFLIMDFNELKEKLNSLRWTSKETFFENKTGVIGLIEIEDIARKLDSFRRIGGK